MPYFAVTQERSARWNWSLPMRRQAEWDAHAAFMDTLVAGGFLLAGGPLGDEDRAARVLHVIDAPEDAVKAPTLVERLVDANTGTFKARS